MAYEFKKLSDVEVIDSPTEAANILIEENGTIKKSNKNKFINAAIIDKIYYIITDAANGGTDTEVMARYVSEGCYTAAYNACILRTPCMIFTSHFWGSEDSQNPYYLELTGMSINEDNSVKLIFKNGFYGQIYPDNTARCWYDN